MRLRVPRCPVCGSELVSSGDLWRCPSDGFCYRVERGRPGRPMWGVEPGEAREPTPSWEEELRQDGWTPEGIEWIKQGGAKRFLRELKLKGA